MLLLDLDKVHLFAYLHYNNLLDQSKYSDYPMYSVQKYHELKYRNFHLS